MKRNAALLIHYYFPPIHSIGCQRNYAFAQEWQHSVKTVKVLTTTNRDCLPRDEGLMIDNFDITAVETNDYRTQSARSNKKTTHYTENQKSGMLAKLAIKAINTYPFNRWLGEGGRHYINQGIQHGKDFLEKHPDAYIYSSFRPYSDHIIAAELKQLYPKTKWIADFRDASVDPLYKLYLHKGWQQRFNRNILKSADKVITVSDGVTQNVSDYHNNVQTVRNGVTLRKNEKYFDKYSITYTGSMYGDHRDPTPMLLAVKRLIDTGEISEEKIQLIYAGKDGKRYQEKVNKVGLKSVFKDYGLVSSAESLEVQSRSQCNLLMTSAAPGYTGILTGKIYEYLGAGNPVLCLISGIKDEEIEQFFDENQLGTIQYIADNDLSNLKNWICKNYEQWIQSQTVTPINTESIKNTLSWSNQFKQLITD